ncbi:PRC-barrel domain containing protein [Streptomyces sp. NPDC048550]|uniref:PRC-barrel domain containing protein n=1 Tax=unclassified Streptomyces TaxID=2593676 RepID=UPI000A42A448|nr:PRC-barrel domain containing protein [Streptomyces sp. NBC_01296]
MTDDMWAYRSGIIHPTGEDLTGYRVEAVDGHIGKVDRHSSEVSDAYIVVDTGVWIFGKEVLLPAGTILRVDRENKTVHLERTKDQIKAAPEFHRDNHLRDPDYRQEISKYYAG